MAPTQVPTLQFSAPQTAQAPATIAPVVTVRQVAASNSNLSVRVNGNVIRAVPGQVIRRVTGEIVRVLDNGSLEPVDLQAPPKAIVTSREKPISLDSESDGSFAGRASSSDSEFEVIKGDISSTVENEASFRISSGEFLSDWPLSASPRRIKAEARSSRRDETKRPPSSAPGAVLRKIDFQNESSSDIPHSIEEQTYVSGAGLDAGPYDPELLTPAVDFSEGTPYAEEKIKQLSSQVSWKSRP